MHISYNSIGEALLSDWWFSLKNVTSILSEKFKRDGLVKLILGIIRFAAGKIFPFQVSDSRFRKTFGRTLMKKSGTNVLYGAFKGLKLREDFYWAKSDLPSMLLGLYEVQVVKELVTFSHKRRNFVEIGSADGFYAAG
jgi:hypothetical protein